MRKVKAMSYAIGLLCMSSGESIAAEAKRQDSLVSSKSEDKVLTNAKPNVNAKDTMNAEYLSAGFLEFLSNTIIEDETMTDPLDMVEIEDSDMKSVNSNSKSDDKKVLSTDQSGEK